MQSNTNINMYDNSAVEFEVVTGCSLSPGQDMGCLSTEEEGRRRGVTDSLH